MFRVSQLFAGYSSINSSPEVITDCAPHTIQTDLHSAFILVGSAYQSDFSICALSLALHTSIISVSTGTNFTPRTVQDVCFRSSTCQITECNWPSALSKPCIWKCHSP